ncbi:hypothetical protein [Flavobacterium yafengii]|uniref:hypothetical protein n=1 Tax=Flavobacterium yafengii TaxID=3041253 RepID=UPI0024A7FCC1|nr:hypothetical protein [Flavobacterium yafengii]MDI5889167.1 hypothetical protein [Flavobacterium yafengii]
MKTTIWLYGQLFSQDWPGQFSTKRKVASLTNKYIFELNKLDIKAEVSFLIDAENGAKAEEKDLEFAVTAENETDENKIWDVIVKVKNKIDY